MINWVAASAFAVYVLNCEGHFWFFYLSTNHSCWLNGSPQSYLVNTLLFDVSVFVVAIMLDKIRIMVWRQMKRLLP